MEELRATARTRVLAYQRDVVSRIAVGNGLWLYGESGTAKTVAAGLIARAAYETGHLVVFSSTVALLAQLKDDLLTESHFDRPSPFDLVENPDLLVLDDLDAAREEDWGLPYLATSLRRRAFRETRAMVVTSSCHPSELGPIVGWSTVRALKDVCGAAVNVDPEYEPPPPDAGVIRAARRARRAARSAI